MDNDTNKAEDNCLVVVLDLDSTLIHRTGSLSEQSPDLKVQYKKTPGSKDATVTAESDTLLDYYYVYFRPYLNRFIDYLNTCVKSKRAKVFIYTASPREYTEKLLQRLFPFAEYCFLENCVQVIETGTVSVLPSHYLSKDVCLVTKASKASLNNERLLFVDDCLNNFKFSWPYGYLIPAWKSPNNSQDNELPKLIQVIDSLLDVDNVKETLRRNGSTSKLCEALVSNKILPACTCNCTDSKDNKVLAQIMPADFQQERASFIVLPPTAL